MKKIIGGCLVVLVLLAAVGLVAAYWMYRKVSTTVAQFSELSAVPELEREVRNTAPFTPPASGVLTDAQVQRLVRVQGRVRQRIGERFGVFRDRYQALLEKQEASVFDVPELVAAYRDVAAGWMEAKRAQVDALNAEAFSLDEYRWVRNQTYAALGVPIMDLDVAAIVEGMKNGGNVELPERIEGTAGPSGPDENRTIVEPSRAVLVENAALASFGL